MLVNWSVVGNILSGDGKSSEVQVFAHGGDSTTSMRKTTGTLVVSLATTSGNKRMRTMVTYATHDGAARIWSLGTGEGK
jgi:hypothetical protein